MENEALFGLTKEEEAKMEVELNQMIAAMRKANEQMASDWIEIERLKAQSRILHAELERKLGGSDAEIGL